MSTLWGWLRSLMPPRSRFSPEGPATSTTATARGSGRRSAGAAVSRAPTPFALDAPLILGTWSLYGSRSGTQSSAIGAKSPLSTEYAPPAGPRSRPTTRCWWSFSLWGERSVVQVDRAERQHEVQKLHVVPKLEEQHQVKKVVELKQVRLFEHGADPDKKGAATNLELPRGRH